MTMEQENALIRRALLEAAALDFAALRGETPPLSSRQEKRLRAMLADPFGYARHVRRPVWKKALHTAAMIAVTAALSLSLLSAASPAVRAAIKAWFMEIRHSDIVYYFMGEPNDHELPDYTISELPEGYEATGEIFETQNYRSITYEDADGRPMYFNYMYMEQGGAHGISTDGMEVYDVMVNGCAGKFFRSIDPAYSNGLIWTDEHSNMQFTIDAHADEMVLLHMAESVSLAKTEKP